MARAALSRWTLLPEAFADFVLAAGLKAPSSTNSRATLPTATRSSPKWMLYSLSN